MERAGDDMAGGRTGATGRRTGNRVVDALGRMDFTGNVIPTAWFETMRDERGRPDLVGMNLLAEIVYRYRPQRSRDEEGREVWSKRFRGDMLPLDYARLEDRFGCSHVTMRRAFARLEGLGVVRRVSQAMRTGAGVAPTVMYVTIDPERLAELTYPAPAGPTRRQRKRAGGDRWSDLTTCDEQAIVENSEAPLPETAESPSTGASRADETPVESRWSKMTTCDEQAIVENSDEAPAPSAEESTHDELRVCDETADDSRW
ncbi:MAG: hypothetical protein J6D54_01765, partial [Olsenella sp.]|nr:hypothetical protein [Olsenella sp.]